jgi:hypothetical protein
LTLEIYPGADGRFDLYEDDGESLDYRQGAFSYTPIEFQEVAKANRQMIRIGPTRGRYAGQAERRTYLVRVKQRLAPVSVSLNGDMIRRHRTRGYFTRVDSGWYYNRRNAQLEIKVPTSIRSVVRLTIAGGVDRSVLELGQRVRHYEARVSAALAVAREWNLPGLETRLQGLQARIRSVASVLARRQTVDVEHRRQVTRVGEEIMSMWQTVGQEVADPTTRSDLAAALLGLGVATWVDPGSDPESAVLRAHVDVALPAPGMHVTLAATPPEGWSGDQPDSASAPTDGGVTTLGVELRRNVQRLPGTLRFRGMITMKWRGQTIEQPVMAEVDNSYLQWFHLIGPFDNTDNKGFDTVYPPEENIDFTRVYPGKEVEARWQTTEWTLPGTGADFAPVFINLIPRFRPNTETVAYAVTYLRSAQPKDVVFALGSDDGAALWLNGEKMYSHPQQRIAIPGQDQVPARLRAGWNTVLMKIVQLPGDWGFYLQVTDPEGRPLPDVWQALEPEA